MASPTSLQRPKGRKPKKRAVVPQPVLRHVPEVLRRAFLATEISICVHGEWLPAADAVAELPTPVFVVTAWNPFSHKTGKAQNRRRNTELRAVVLEKTDDIHPAVGTSSDSLWREESLAVSGISRAEAKALGYQFDQHAVFEIGRDKLSVLGCSGGWQRFRAFDEEVEVAPPCGSTLAQLLRDELGLETNASFDVALHRGWTLEDDLGVACPKCGSAGLLLAGCDIAPVTALPYRATAFVCSAEPRVMAPRDIPGRYRALVDARRAYTTASADAAAAAAAAAERGSVERHYHAYVVELDDHAGARVGDKPWVYVGVSTYPPEERLAQHFAGIRASKCVQKHGVHLRPDLTSDQPTLRTDQEAKAYERFLYEWLIVMGWPTKGGT